MYAREPGSRYTQSTEASAIRAVQIPCRYHPGSICLNYCQEPKCTKLLCEQCIEQHLVQHKKENLPVQSIRSFKKIRELCSGKLFKLIEELSARMSSLRQPKNPQQILQQADMKFEAIKKVMFEIVEQELGRFYQQLRSKVNQSFSAIKSLEEVHSRLSQIIRQLAQNRRIIVEGAPEITDTVQKVLTLNDKVYIHTFNHETSGYLQKLNNVDFEINMNQGKFRNTVVDCLKISQSEGMNGEQSRLGRSASSSRVVTGYSPTHYGSKSSNFKQSHKQNNNSVPVKLESQLRILHFFENQSSFLHILDLSDPSDIKRERIALPDFTVPSLHASILITQKNIFITGGIEILDQDNERKSTRVSKYSMKSSRPQKFKPDFAEVRPRSSHSLCEHDEYIYILGGYGEQISADETVEKETTLQRVNIRSGAVTTLANSLYGGSCVCAVFGDGIMKASEQGVEFYSITRNKWSSIKADPQYFYPISCGWTKIAKDTLLVYGGYKQNGDENTDTLVWTMGEGSLQCRSTGVNLPSSEDFRNNPGVIINGCVYALQILESGNEEKTEVEDERKILYFNGSSWQETIEIS